MLLLFIATLVAKAIPLVNQNLGFVAALIFLLVPGFLLRRRGEHEADYGLGFGDWRVGFRWGAALTLVTLVGFVPMYHLWQTHVEGRQAHVSVQNYRQLGQQFYGVPERIDDGNVHVWTQGGAVHVAWMPQKAPYHLNVDTTPQLALAEHVDDFVRGEGVATIRRQGDSPQQVHLRFRNLGSPQLLMAAREDTHTLSSEHFVAGASSASWMKSRQMYAIASMGFWGMFGVLLTQIVLVAIPEEFFFRGYLQERFHKAWGRAKWTVLGLPITWGIVVSSVLFALVHVVATPHVTRLAVFFPSLLFGALREKTGGITASVFYHTACNLMVLWASVHYF